jgi:hypothetical protein
MPITPPATVPDPRIRPVATALPRQSPWHKRLEKAHSQVGHTNGVPPVLLEAADDPDEAVNIAVLDGLANTFSHKRYAAYLLWLVSKGTVEETAAFEALNISGVDSRDRAAFTFSYASLWERTVENALSRLHTNGAIVTPLVAMMYVTRQELCADAHDSAEDEFVLSQYVSQRPSNLPLGLGMDVAEQSLTDWIAAQVSASSLTDLQLPQSRWCGWANELVMAHSPLVATRGGMISLAPFWSSGGARAALTNDSMTDAGYAVLLEYAFQSLSLEDDAEHNPIALLDALRERGVTLGPEYMDRIRISAGAHINDRSFRGPVEQSGPLLARIREVCADTSLRQWLWTDCDGSRAEILRSTPPPAWGALVLSLAEGDPSWHERLGGMIEAAADWQLPGVDRAFLARLMECPSASVRAAALGLSPRLPVEAPPAPSKARTQ